MPRGPLRRLDRGDGETGGRPPHLRLQPRAAPRDLPAGPQIDWYWNAEGGPSGPLSLEAVRTGIETGRIPSGAHLWREGLAEWIPAREALATTDDGTRWVVLARPDFDPNALADAVARAVGMPRVEATVRLKKHWGMIHRAENVAVGEASVASLAAAGFEAFLLSEAERTDPPEPEEAESLDPEGEGLRVSFRRGDPVRVPFAELALLGAGRIDESSAPTRPQSKPDERIIRATKTIGMLTGIPFGGTVGKMIGEKIAGPAPSAMSQKKTIVRFLLEFATRSGIAYRVEEAEIRAYEPLREKVAAIAAAAPGAVLNRGARAALAETTAKVIKYDSEEGYEAERRWLWQVIRRG